MDLPDETHTAVGYRDGWRGRCRGFAETRHVGLMVGSAMPGRKRTPRALGDAYQSEIEKTRQLAARLRGASLQHVPGRADASLYSASTYAGPHYLLVGDAGSFIDPLSSHGVKKALASAWMAAVAVNTCLVDPQRQAPALDFFSRLEREVEATHARHSSAFAVEAAARHPHRFWQDRAAAPERRRSGRSGELADVEPSTQTDVAARSSTSSWTSHAGRVPQAGDPRPRDRAAKMHSRRRRTPPRRCGSSTTWMSWRSRSSRATCKAGARSLRCAYCRTVAPAPLPSVLGGLSWLVAAWVLRQRTAISW